VITKSNAVIPIENLPFQEVLALSTQAVTAFYMTDVLSPVLEKDKVLIHAAAGGVGSMLIQLAKRKGAQVIAKVGTHEKVKVAKELGADFVINYNEKEYSKEVRNVLNGAALDVVYNPVGGSTFKKDWKLLGSGGRLFIFGGSELSDGKFGLLSSLNFLRKMGLVIPATLMMSSKSILGVNMLKIADTRPEIMQSCLLELMKLYTSNKIQVCVGGSFNVSQISQAHELLESGKSKGKISVFWG
jgi:NADPH2:quinone reductase